MVSNICALLVARERGLPTVSRIVTAKEEENEKLRKEVPALQKRKEVYKREYQRKKRKLEECRQEREDWRQMFRIEKSAKLRATEETKRLEAGVADTSIGRRAVEAAIHHRSLIDVMCRAVGNVQLSVHELRRMNVVYRISVGLLPVDESHCQGLDVSNLQADGVGED